MQLIWNIDPMGAPRMTRADAWKKRPVVERYHVFRDEVSFAMKKSRVDWSKLDTLTATFFIEMPKSWSKQKKEFMLGGRHQQKPDSDNLAKALLDSLFRDGGDDCQVSDLNIKKRWSDKGRIEITI